MSFPIYGSHGLSQFKAIGLLICENQRNLWIDSMTHVLRLTVNFEIPFNIITPRFNKNIDITYFKSYLFQLFNMR